MNVVVVAAVVVVVAVTCNRICRLFQELGKNMLNEKASVCQLLNQRATADMKVAGTPLHFFIIVYRKLNWFDIAAYFRDCKLRILSSCYRKIRTFLLDRGSFSCFPAANSVLPC